MGGFVRLHLRFVRVFGTPFKAIEGVKLFLEQLFLCINSVFIPPRLCFHVIIPDSECI